MKSAINLKAALSVAVDAACKAGDIQKANWGGRLEIRMKGRIDPVTQVDLDCEEVIVRTIQSAFPDHALLAEERGYEKDRKPGPNDSLWIIDPLDGTVNFAHGYPRFAVSIAMSVGGITRIGAVYDPIMDEMYTAISGQGAHLNGKPIHVSRTASMESALLCTGFAYNLKTARRNNIGTHSRALRMAQGVRRDGCAALNLCHLAAGRFDGFWELYLKPWDIAAADLIIREAGGRTCMYDGSPLDLFGNEIVASNGKLHKAMLQLVRPPRQ